MRQAACVNTPIPERRNKQSPLTRILNKARRDGLLADHQPETPRLIEGNLPLLPSEQESTLCRGIRKPIGELATQTDALRYPGTHEALQPAYLLPCPQGRKAALTLRATGRIECAQTLWGKRAKRFRRLFLGVRLVNQGREACAITHVTDVPSPWHACAIAVARLCHRGGTTVPIAWHIIGTTKYY